MLRLLPVVVFIGIWVFCLIDCIQTPEEEMRNLPKVVWIILILLLDVIGGVIWLVAGRPQARRVGAPWPSTRSAGFPEYERPRSSMAPDDDPVFLRGLKSSNDEHEKMLKKWEEDLKRREDEMRGDPPNDGPVPPRA